MKIIRIQNQLSVAFLIAFVLGTGACVRTPKQKRDRFVESGKKLYEKHEYARAVLEFKNAAAAMPKDAEVYYQMGRTYAANHDYQTAANTLQKALQLNPKHPGAQLELSKILAATIDPDNLQDAESRLTALLQGGWADPEALNSLALTQMKLGKIDSAVESLNRALALAPRALASSVMLAQAKLTQNDFKEAEAVLQKACADAPKSPEARVILGSFYVARNRLSEAEQQFQHALTLNPKQPAALLETGKLVAALGRKQEAEQLFKRLAALPDPTTRPSYGFFLLQEGRREEAIHEFEQLAKNSPEDRPSRTRLVAVYWSFGLKQNAEKVLQSALEKNPKDPDALLQRGELYLMDGRYAKAETDLNQVLHQKPNSAELHYIMSKLHEARGSVLLQRQELSEALRFNPSLLQVRLELCQLLLAGHAAQSALQVLKEAPGFQQQWLPVIVQRNWVFLALGDLTQVRKGIEQGLLSSRAPDLLIQDGLLKVSSGDFKGARESLEEALRIKPDDLRALNILTRSYVQQKQGKLALQKAQEHVAKQPKSAPMQEFLGFVLLASGDRDRARAAFLAAKAADPKYSKADLSLVQLDALEEKWDDARVKLKSVLSTDPQNSLARLWLGHIEATQGDRNAAIEHFRKVVAGSPDNAQALNELAYLLSDYEKRPDDALKYAEKAAELAPTNPDYLDTLGWTLYQKGLYDTAIEHLKRAAASPKPNPVWQYHLAMAYAKAGQSEKARVALDSALKLDSKVPEAQLAVAVIKASK
jgi:tetratricopeptide (TPR) repeat protein